ncbi:MAG TPA: mercuric reductase [Anaerolineae bacterium]|nr:mercuric reductase [Anaerolineae bacterium]
MKTMIHMDEHEWLAALPKDEYNERRIQNAHPANWENPKPADVYNVVVIGGGSGGLIVAIIAASLGAKVALVEKHLMGGDCLNTGCVPSKAMIRSAKVMGEIMHAHRFGIETNGAKVNFDQVMRRIRQVQAEISPVDSVWRYTEEGVDVFLGHGRFTGRNTLQVGSATLRFKKAIIATGSQPYVPAIEGLAVAGFLTNETVWNLTTQPRRLAVVGGGPIGSELAQAFQRLGTQVIQFHNADHLLNREDADAAEIVQRAFVREGIKLILNAKVGRVELKDGEKIVHYSCPAEGSGTVAVDEILVATGRVPNTRDLGLEQASVKVNERGSLIVNDYLQTTNRRIYGVGDVALPYQFTHAAAATGKLVVQNALFLGRKKFSSLTMPWTTYTDPEIAHVGMYEHQAREQGIEIDTYHVKFEENDRAQADGEEEGFVKIHTRKGSDKILGATVVARAAGEIINEITLAMVAGIGLGKLSDVIHPYPTQAEAIVRAAGQYRRTRLTPTIQKVFTGWMSLTRKL